MKRFAYYEPKTIKEASRLLHDLPMSTLLAGGTDLVTRMNKGTSPYEHIINLKYIEGLDYIKADEQGIHVGAATKLAKIAQDEHVKKHFPALVEAINSIGTPQIRHLGTMGGNLCNASPCADSAPALMVMDTVLTLSGLAGKRRVPMTQFYLGPGITSRGQDEVLTDIFIPFQEPGTGQSFSKLGPRKAADIAVVNTAMALTFNNGVCCKARIALGSVAPTLIRAYATEEWLIGKKKVDICPEETGKRAAEEAKPISDVRGSAEYRKDMVAVLVERAVMALVK